MNKFLLFFSLCMGCIGGNTTATPPAQPPPETWGIEDLCGVWEIAHEYTTPEGEKGNFILNIVFDDEYIILYGKSGVRVLGLFEQDTWIPINIKPSKGDIHENGITTFHVNYGEYPADISLYEGVMSFDREHIEGLSQYFGNEEHQGWFYMTKLEEISMTKGASK